MDTNDSFFTNSTGFDFENYSQYRNFAQRLETDIIFVFVSTILLLVSLAAFVLETLLLISLVQENLVPVNVKIILINLAGACAVLSTALICHAVTNLIFQSMRYPSVDLFKCSLLQSLRILSGSAVLSFTLIMGVERFIASRRAVVGKNQTKKSAVVISLIVITWLWSGINLVILILRNYSLTHIKLAVCDVILLAYPDKVFITYLEIYVPLEVALVVFFWGFWLYQRQILRFRGMNTAQHNLSERMTILENVGLTNTLLPTISLHAVCNVFYAVFILIGYFYLSRYPWGINYIQLGHLFNAVYSVLNPLVVFRMNATLTKSLSNVKWITVFIDICFNGGKEWRNRKRKKYYPTEGKAVENGSPRPSAEEHNEVKLHFDNNDKKLDSVSEEVEIKQLDNVNHFAKTATIIMVKPSKETECQNYE